MKIPFMEVDSKGNLILPAGKPFDGNPILAKTNTGFVEAWFCKDNWQWVCYDDQFQLEFDDVIAWFELPKDEDGDLIEIIKQRESNNKTKVNIDEL